MKKHVHKALAFLLVWFWSQLAFAAYHDGNIISGIISTLIGGIGYWLLVW